MIKAYIDCNILLDWLLDREPFSSYSAKIIELTETKKILGLVSPLTLANTYYVISKELNKKIADEFIIDSLRIFSVPGISLKNVNKRFPTNSRTLKTMCTARLPQKTMWISS